MALRTAGLLLCAALALATAVQAAKPLDVAVESVDSDFSMFGALIDSLGLTKDLPDATTGTLFAPSNRAIQRFLADMSGMTFDELKARPQLVDAVVSMHFVPGVTITDSAKAQAFVSSDPQKPTTLATADLGDVIELWRSKGTGLWVLKDMQGNLASVITRAPRMNGRVAIWGVSAVLMSTSYYDGADDALRANPELSTAYELRQQAATLKGGAAEAFTAGAGRTYFVPTNAAFGAAGKALAAAPAKALDELFAYSTLPGVKSIPKGFTDGGKVETLLKGHSVTTKIKYVPETNTWTGATIQVPQMRVVDENGREALVVLDNLFAGKSIIQAIDAVIAPKGSSLPLPSAPKAGAAGRRLLQYGSTRLSSNSAWASQNTADAIAAAANGDVPTAFATHYGRRQAALANCVNCGRWGIMY